MRFLADENFPGDAVTALRAAGHDVSEAQRRSTVSLDHRYDAPGT